jgi:hypothetical protein
MLIRLTSNTSRAQQFWFLFLQRPLLLMSTFDSSYYQLIKKIQRSLYTATDFDFANW